MTDKDTKPLAELDAAERTVNPPVLAQEPPQSTSMEPGSTPDGWVAPDPEPDAAARLRAFEDEKLGPHAPRFDGRVERGHGSLLGRMSAEDKARHAELEKAAEDEANAPPAA